MTTAPSSSAGRLQQIAWFPLTELPTYSTRALSNAALSRAASEGRANAKFYMVVPFMAYAFLFDN